MIAALGKFALERYHEQMQILELARDMIVRSFRNLVNKRFRVRETIDQMFVIGVGSIPIMLFALIFISLMLIVEFSFHMKLVIRQDSLVPAFSTVLLVRELGPIVTCLLLASRVGAAIAAEIGTMKVTDQLDALRLLSIDPVEYLVIPRWTACVLCSALLSVTSVCIALGGGCLLAASRMGLSSHEFFNSMFVFLRVGDVAACVVKASVFGAVIPVIAAHHGLKCRYGAQGVGDAATRSVVHSSLTIIVLDFVLTYLMYAL